MTKLARKPDSTSYSFKDRAEVVNTGLDGGLGRNRRDLIGVHPIVDVTWVVPPSWYSYICAFFRANARNGGEAFQLDLILETAAITEYDVKLVPGSFRLTNKKADSYTVTAQVEVQQHLTPA